METGLVRKIKDGDREAFDRFCLTLYPAMLSYAKVFLSDEGAEDIVQDVMLGVWRRREILDENYDPRIYIFRSIYNRSLNYLKREQLASDFRSWNERRIAMYEHETLDPDRNPVVRRLLDGDLKDSLLKAIDALPPKRQEISKKARHIIEYSRKPYQCSPEEDEGHPVGRRIHASDVSHVLTYFSELK